MVSEASPAGCGVAGTLVVEKVVGAAAEQGTDLKSLKALGDKVNRATRSMGVALTSCTVPAAGKLACAGCGASLQTRDQAAAGFIPTHKKLMELAARSEDALRMGTDKFERRFRAMERALLEAGGSVSTTNPTALDAAWEKAKEAVG